MKDLDPSEIVDIEQHARDQIVKYVGAKFSGHGLARLVEAILKSHGYITTKSEPGKDGGIDILAGSGALGFNEPLICAQIKFLLLRETDFEVLFYKVLMLTKEED